MLGFGMNERRVCAAGSIRESGIDVARERLTGQRIDHDRARAGEITGPRRQRGHRRERIDRRRQVIAGIVQEEGRARPAVEDVGDGQRTAERRAVALLDVVGLLAHTPVERVGRGVEHRAAERVVGVALDTSAAAHAAEPAWAAANPARAAAAATAAATAPAEAPLLTPAAEAAFAAAAESFGATVAELPAATAASAKEQRLVRLSLDAGGRHRFGRRISGKPGRQLELGAEVRRGFITRSRRG